MSFSNITPSSPPKAVGVFLAKFDKTEGYKLIWSKSTKDISFEGLEYKALPSGVHQYETNTIYLSHKVNDELYYGSARFRSLNLNSSTSDDRELMKLYSLGILMEPINKSWKPHAFANIGWEYLDQIDDALISFLNSEDRSVLNNLFSKVTGADSLQIPKSGPSQSPVLNHPLFKLPLAFSAAGPLIFPLYKAALLRKRILILNSPSQAGPLLQEGTARDFTTAGALAYLISIISIIPNEVQKPSSNNFSEPLYTVGLNNLDTEDDSLTTTPAFVANSSDEILKYQQELYDNTFVTSTSESEPSFMYESNDLKSPVKATFNDYIKFLKAYKTLPDSLSPPATADDASSIRTSTSFMSRFNFGVSEDAVVPCEPVWWKSNATSPMSWGEYIWSAFAWFASAGTTTRSATEQCIVLDSQDEDQSRVKDREAQIQGQLEELVKVITNFHSLTKKWFIFIQEIVDEVKEELKEREHEHGHLGPDQQDTLLDKKVCLELTHSDLVDMELDPYSAQDIEFVREFVLFYWGDDVEDIEVGSGIGLGFCC